MELKSIQTRIALWAGLCLLITSTALITYSLVSANNAQEFVNDRVSTLLDQGIRERLKARASAEASEIQNRLAVAMEAGRTLAQTFTSVKIKDEDGYPIVDIGRPEMNAILMSVLEQNDDFLATYSAWEPKGLDMLDRSYRNDTELGYDETGRFIPYWVRNVSGTIPENPSALTHYDNPQQDEFGRRLGDYYLCPKDTRKECIIDPYNHRSSDKQQMITSLVTPIIHEGTFYGITGIDLDASFLQELAVTANSQLYNGAGEMIIVSDNGVIGGYSRQPDLTGKHVKRLVGETWDTDRENIRQGRLIDSIDATTDGDVIKILAPIRFRIADARWAVIIRIPLSVVMAEVTELDRSLTRMNRENATWQAGVGVGVTLAALLLIWFMSRSIARPIRSAVRMADSIRLGDLSRRQRVCSEDEVGQLGNALNAMADGMEKKANLANAIAEGDLTVSTKPESSEDKLGIALETMRRNLSDMVASIQAATAQVAEGSRGLSESSQSLSDGAADQASSLEQISASMTEIDQQTHANTENATEACLLSEVTTRAAQGGYQQVKNMVAAMDEIKHSSEDIERINEALDAIAQQTNLLALNAAIEAARAGEAGRGFAVVAGEVRELASRSASAAQESSSLIRSTVDKIETGVRIAENTAEAFDEINTSVSRAADIIARITEGATEQAQGVHQVNKGLEHIDRVTQQNAQGAEETAQASVEQSYQADQLRSMLKRFKI